MTQRDGAGGKGKGKGRGRDRRSAREGNERAVASAAAGGWSYPSLLGPKLPHWSCAKCGDDENWACRLHCRGCGKGGTLTHQQKAFAAHAKALKEQSQSEPESPSPSPKRPRGVRPAAAAALAEGDAVRKPRTPRARVRWGDVDVVGSDLPESDEWFIASLRKRGYEERADDLEADFKRQRAEEARDKPVHARAKELTARAAAAHTKMQQTAKAVKVASSKVDEILELQEEAEDVLWQARADHKKAEEEHEAAQSAFSALGAQQPLPSIALDCALRAAVADAVEAREQAAQGGGQPPLAGGLSDDELGLLQAAVKANDAARLLLMRQAERKKQSAAALVVPKVEAMEVSDEEEDAEGEKALPVRRTKRTGGKGAVGKGAEHNDEAPPAPTLAPPFSDEDQQAIADEVLASERESLDAATEHLRALAQGENAEKDAALAAAMAAVSGAVGGLVGKAVKAGARHRATPYRS